MFLTLIIGETGSGKSSIAKAIWNKATHSATYDFQNEYEAPVFNGKLLPKFRVIPTNHTVNVFYKLDKVVKGYTWILEECTGLFASGKIPEEFVQRILSKRHSANNWVLIFHTIQDVPPKLLRFRDVIILFRTGDSPENVKKKAPFLLDDYTRLQTSGAKKPSPSGSYMINDYVVIKSSNLSKNKI